MSTAAQLAGRVYERWNAGLLAALADSVDPEIELVCDPLRPAESTLRGIEGWTRWAQRWERSYASMHVTIDGLIPMDREHVLALVSIDATPAGGGQPRRWAAAHVWTVRDGRIARWEMHVDLAVARHTLD